MAAIEQKVEIEASTSDAPVEAGTAAPAASAAESEYAAVRCSALVWKLR